MNSVISKASEHSPVSSSGGRLLKHGLKTANHREEGSGSQQWQISAVCVIATSSLKAQALLPPWISPAGKSSCIQMAKIQIHIREGKLRTKTQILFFLACLCSNKSTVLPCSATTVYAGRPTATSIQYTPHHSRDSAKNKCNSHKNLKCNQATSIPQKIIFWFVEPVEQTQHQLRFETFSEHSAENLSQCLSLPAGLHAQWTTAIFQTIIAQNRLIHTST